MIHILLPWKQLSSPYLIFPPKISEWWLQNMMYKLFSIITIGLVVLLHFVYQSWQQNMPQKSNRWSCEFWKLQGNVILLQVFRMINWVVPPSPGEQLQQAVYQQNKTFENSIPICYKFEISYSNITLEKENGLMAAINYVPVLNYRNTGTLISMTNSIFVSFLK